MGTLGKSINPGLHFPTAGDENSTHFIRLSVEEKGVDVHTALRRASDSHQELSTQEWSVLVWVLWRSRPWAKADVITLTGEGTGKMPRNKNEGRGKRNRGGGKQNRKSKVTC